MCPRNHADAYTYLLSFALVIWLGFSSDSTRSLFSSLLSPIATTKQISLPNITQYVAQEASFPVLSLMLTAVTDCAVFDLAPVVKPFFLLRTADVYLGKVP